MRATVSDGKPVKVGRIRTVLVMKSVTVGMGENVSDGKSVKVGMIGTFSWQRSGKAGMSKMVSGRESVKEEMIGPIPGMKAAVTEMKKMNFKLKSGSTEIWESLSEITSSKDETTKTLSG